MFSGKAEATEGAREGEIDKPHAKIGQRVVEQSLFEVLPVKRRAITRGAT